MKSGWDTAVGFSEDFKAVTGVEPWEAAYFVVNPLGYMVYVGVDEFAGNLQDNWENTADDESLNLFERGYIAAGGAAGTLIGVENLENAREGRNREGEELSMGERAVEGLVGGVGVVSTAVGLKGAGSAIRGVGGAVDDVVDAVGDAGRLGRQGDDAAQAISKQQDDLLPILNNGGCFIPGTPVRLSAQPAVALASQDHARWPAIEWSDAENDATVETVSIEAVPLGARVAEQNPRPEDYDFSLPEVDEATWRQVDIRVSRTDGAQVELSLLRPVAWIAQYGLEPGKQFTLVLSEIEVDGRATVTAIGPCPPIAASDGQVVIGRFKTHQVSNLVEVTLETGTQFTGTNTHPVWLPDEAAWVTLEDLRPGDRLDTLAGPLAVASVAPREAISDVYNLETHGHHVYRITEDGVLVHNNAECPLGTLNRPNLNSNAAVSRFGLYEIEISGTLYKIGKADLNRITKSSGLPTRLHQQIRKLEQIFGKGNIVGKVVDDLGDGTTEYAKLAEHSRIWDHFNDTGFVPLGNWKSFRP